VAGVSAGALTLRTDAGDVQVALPASVPVVDLAHAGDAQAPLAPGTPVNVGAEQTPGGLVLTGVVAVQGAAR
jgi:hypothetical protein